MDTLISVIVIAVFVAILLIIFFIRKAFKNALNKQVDKETFRIQQEADRKLQDLISTAELEFQHERSVIDIEYAKKKDHIQQLTKEYQKIVNESEQSHPYLAELYADFLFAVDQNVADYLAHKSPPARIASENVRQIAKKNRALQKENKLLQYQLLFYESLFPSLCDFKEYSIEDAIDYSNALAEKEPEKDSEEARMSKYLSHDEYLRLDDVDRYQLALDRYKNRQKTNWEIGIEYERFIGYMFEENGFRVNYHGAKMGLEDLGRDLIASKNGKTYIVQCKRWAQHKEIHEKHIFQLYGSMVAWTIEHDGQEAKGVFCATTELSPTAKQYAKYLCIEFRLISPGDYPLIKCNIGKNGEKIFHLPFDQQYDNVVISKEKGEKYVSTVKEAIAFGFRRAYRWRG